MTDLRQTKEYAAFQKKQGFKVIFNNGIYYYIKTIPVLGGILKIQRPDRLDYETINNLSRKYRIFYTIIEPSDSIKTDLWREKLAESGFKPLKRPFLPSKTLLINLKRPVKAIYKNLKRNIKKGLKTGEGQIIKIYSTPLDLKFFAAEWKRNVRNKRYVPDAGTLIKLKKSFPQNKSLFLASHNISGRIIGGVIFTTSSHEVSNYIIFESVHYMYGFTSEEGRSSLSHASLLYKGILWGKKLGCNVFDFEGIYDPRFPIPEWLGFSRFKKSFGGYEVAYPGCFSRINFINKIPFK
jgi:hypothetical protein